ncbi:hypothetical protein SORBI_3005G089101 [Sorghum bicolor]|uniref:Core Histone H2A/H2B/H3 domain-containing protein n=1 Tax=Sorghum bicolor TaxID=4558 RepID=A0A1Z5RI22_SORBI|nr:hypothetical protein SORBI_3005G089101 [Sorghum bicolor]
MSNGSEDRSEHPQELNGSSPTPLMTPQEQEIDDFWRRRQEDIENLMNFNNHNLPIENIEEIIRANLGSVMTSSDTPPYVTKLCELFIQELAIRAWMCASSHGRYTILESDITEAINSTKPYSFLNGVLPSDGSSPLLSGNGSSPLGSSGSSPCSSSTTNLAPLSSTMALGR